MPIRLLSESVSSMIAAGEVVERPASVVKELVENALDAGATDVSIDIRGGGVEQIRVADNGCGIPSDEVEIAFQRFATSKIGDASDLNTIHTLGFRGEALPSIASVARVSVVTRHADEEIGALLELDSGSVVSKRQRGASPGTVMTVKQLFHNVPARRKFLRTVGTETSQIQNLVTRYALAYPEVRFALNTGSSKLLTTGSGDLREAVASIYGAQVAEGMLDIAFSSDAPDTLCVVDGMGSQPALNRANRSYISLFVNRRWVQSRMLGYALEQAYHGFLKERRYPIAIINVGIDYEQVDVNAHPAKTEVRFRNGNAVFSAIQQAVRQTLTAHSPVPEVRRAGTTFRPHPIHASSVQPERNFWPIEPFEPSADVSSDGIEQIIRDMREGNRDSAGEENAPTHKQALPALRALGQALNTYIVAEGPDGVYLIDQHAAHERVMFERIKADADAGAPQSQSLMETLTIDLNPRQLELAQSHSEVFVNLGLLIEPFGGSVYIIRAVPDILVDEDAAKAFIDMLDEMAQGGDVETWAERAAYSLACHAAIRAGKVLSREEMAALTRQLERCDQPHTCPHGRPTMIHIGVTHMEREFGRR